MPDNNSKVKAQKSKVQTKSKKVEKTEPVSVMEKKTKKETVEKTVSVARVSKGKDITAPLFDTKGKETGTIALPAEIFGAKENKQLVAQAVRVYLANQRKGNASTKTRGEVQGSSRKIYRQKGTGRARHGSIRAPIFVHGGIVFGPKPRDYSLDFPQKMKRVALFSALSTRLSDGGIKFVGGMDKVAHKTKEMNKVFESLGLISKKTRVLFVLPPQDKKGVDPIARATRNIEGVDLLYANQLNTYAVLTHKNVLIFAPSVETMKAVFLK